MTQDVCRFVHNCNTCSKSKIWQEQKHGLLKPLPIPKRIWSKLSVDFITGLAPSKDCTSIMIVTDRLSKSIIAMPMKETRAIDVAQTLLEYIFQHHGLSTAIVSNRGTQFVGMLWIEVCPLVKITQRLSTAFHPEVQQNKPIRSWRRIFASSLYFNRKIGFFNSQ